MPTLPPLREPEPDEAEEEEEEEPMQEQQPDGKQRKHTSGPKVQDPYSVSDSSSMLIPIAVAFAAFLPILYCLCKI